MRIAATTALAAAAGGGAMATPGPVRGASSTTHEISCVVSFPEKVKKNEVFDVQKTMGGFLSRLHNNVNGVTVQPLSSAPTGTYRSKVLLSPVMKHPSAELVRL